MYAGNGQSGGGHGERLERLLNDYYMSDTD